MLVRSRVRLAKSFRKCGEYGYAMDYSTESILNKLPLESNSMAIKTWYPEVR